MVATGKQIEPGQSSSRIPAVRRRLFATGDFVGADLESMLYDEAVVRFQARHGLEQDAVIGRQTVAAMRVTAEYGYSRSWRILSVPDVAYRSGPSIRHGECARIQTSRH